MSGSGRRRTLGMGARTVAAIGALAFAALQPAPAAAQDRLFSEESEIAFTLNAPFGKLNRAAKRSTDPVAATIAVPDAPAPIPLEIAPRGFTRRTSLCSAAPLRLDFEKPAMRGTVFQGQNKLKLVVQCKPPGLYEQLLLREYTVYRLYNAVTPFSFRVRLARVTYADSEDRDPGGARFAFLIEDADDVAKRNGLKQIPAGPRELNSAQLDPAAAARFALFAFVIGNLDWEYFAGPPGDTCCHNAKLVGTEGATANIIPVPYDFDFSALVDAPYATPPAGLDVASAHERYYRGHCRNNEHLPAAAALLREKRATLTGIITGETRLSDSSKREMLSYLADSYAILDDPRRFERLVIGRCR
ncbi:MAG: hypothetical protein NW200_02790 [Hyphomonadaceae bacterium]|nr:hypothetical protein [Hyphomonadaceae bacterium]